MTTLESSRQVETYSVGLCMASACAPIAMNGDQVAAAVNRQHPTGVGPWDISGNPTFRNGPTNPCPCERDTDRQHWLLEC